MKRFFLTLSVFFFSYCIFAQEVPELLKGVWANSSRYIVFDNTPQIVLRTFYRWYDDRAAESSEYTHDNPRPINNTTQKIPPEELRYEFEPITEFSDKEIGAWNIIIHYPKRKEKYYVPVAVIGDKLYLKFAVRKNTDSGFWQDAGNATGLKISPAISSKELKSFYIADNTIYYIRYWKTDMEYDSSTSAVFTDNGKTYSVPKHLKVSETTYTCVTGRSTKIRNITKDTIESSEFSMKEDATICTLDAPYMTKVQEKSLEQILQEDSLKKPPRPEPLFPPHGVLDFDWSIIEDPPKDYRRRMLDLGK